MNDSLRFSTAISISLLFHLALLTWLMHLAKTPVPHGPGPFKVFLRNAVQEPGVPPVQSPASSHASTIKIPEARQEPPPAEASGTSAPPRNLSAPQFQPADMMNSMQRAQLARQHELSRAAVMAQMSDIAAQLRPLVTENIICEQQKGGGIDCTPDAEGKLRGLLEQFSRVANDAHQLDIMGNPAHIDFGQGKGVSVKLTSP